jgi:phospholipid transport system substrate-binding protein
VIAEGVSDLALKRSEYGAVIGKEGIDALIAKLEAKIASYAANNK